MIEGANISELCRGFGISRKSGYKWLRRFGSGDQAWFEDRSRRPHRAPRGTSEEVAAAVLAVRELHPAWGGRKIRRRLEMNGHASPPAPSTITEVLRRHGRINPEESRKRGPLQRFERESPNELWQMDFKGGVPTLEGMCHPLTVVDDHSRFSICVRACGDQREETVQPHLIWSFREYGLPDRMLMDNGSCWGRAESRYTKLGAWLLRLDIGISHPRFYHPQTQGKNERFNQTLKAEAIRDHEFASRQDCQRAFDHFRHIYNHERPHEALNLDTPASRYCPGRRPYSETLPPISYEAQDIVRKVGPAGYLSYCHHRYQVGRAFTGEPVALRPTETDGVLEIIFCRHRVAKIDLRTKSLEQT
jgi:transposase InsO family protein